MQCLFKGRGKTLHQDFACSHLAKAKGSAVFLLCPLPLCPAALLPSHHHLFPGTTLCPPFRANAECWHPHTTETGGGRMYVCDCVVIHTCGTIIRSDILFNRRSTTNFTEKLKTHSQQKFVSFYLTVFCSGEITIFRILQQDISAISFIHINSHSHRHASSFINTLRQHPCAIKSTYASAKTCTHTKTYTYIQT